MLYNRLLNMSEQVGSGEDKTWTRGPWTPPLDWVHRPLSWTGSMDSFFYFYKKVLHQVHGQSKTEIVPKKKI